MKSLAVGLFVGVLAVGGLAVGPVAMAQTSLPAAASSGTDAGHATEAPVDAQHASAESAANEAAGLPDLDTINRPAASVTSTVELNTVREPSFHTRDGAGTEVTEYRDRGKPTEIDVRSNFGTRYQMSAPTDNSPRVPSNGAPNGRVPSIRLSY